MKLNLRPVIAGAATLAITGGVLAATVGTAAAAGPPWEPDPNSIGSINFYNAAGAPITGGSNLNHLADYIEASTTDALAGTKATLVFANPAPSTPTGSFFTASGSASTAFPNAAAPAPLNTDSKPVVTLGAGDANLTNFIASSTPNTVAGYQNVYQLRLVTSGPGGVGTSGAGTYWEDDIVVNPSTGSWTIQFPGVVTATNTTLAASPNPALTTQSVTLTATESPAAAGSVQFKDGASNIGSAVAVNGSGVATLSQTFTAGSHSLSAVFSPTDTSSFTGSTGTTTLQVDPPSTPTATTLAVTQDGFATHDVSLSATVKNGATPVTAGTVSFYDNGGSTALNPTGITPDASGVAAFDIPAGLAAGSHSIVAKFTPTNPANFQASQSSPQAFFLNPPAATGSPCAQTGSQCTDTQYIQGTIPIGTLVISTPYTQASPLDLGTLSLNATATGYQATAPFTNIVVTDNRSGGLGWTASALASPLNDGGSNPNSVINAQNVGLTNLVSSQSAGDTGVVALTNNPAASPAVAPGDTGSLGLGGTTPHVFATQTVSATQVGDGTVGMSGVLTLNAPTSTESGLFKGTITFTVG